MPSSPGLLALETAAALPAPAGANGSLGDFCKLPANKEFVEQHARSTKKKDLTVTYCKALKHLWQLEAILIDQHQLPSQSVESSQLQIVPYSQPKAQAKSRSTSVRAIDPEGVQAQHMPSLVQPFSIRQVIFKWLYWPWIVRSVVFFLTALTVFKPHWIIHFVSAWIRLVVSALYTEIMDALWTSLSSLWQPFWTPVSQASSYLDSVVAMDNNTDTSSGTFVLAMLSFGLGRFAYPPAHPGGGA